VEGKKPPPGPRELEQKEKEGPQREAGVLLLIQENSEEKKTRVIEGPHDGSGS